MESEREPRAAEGVSQVHFTEDGPIHLWAYAQKGGWRAVHWGRQLAGGRHFKMVEAANAYLLDSFRQMFPEHVCNERCGTSDALAQRQAAEEMNFRDYSEG